MNYGRRIANLTWLVWACASVRVWTSGVGIAVRALPLSIPTVLFLIHFGVNLRANYPSIVQTVRLAAGADVNNWQLFRSVGLLH